MRAIHPAWAVFEYYLTTYRRVWRGTVFSSFVLPVLFFLSIGLMVGEYVDRGGALPVPYTQFIGPGLLAFTGVQIALMEAGYPVMGGFKWNKTYYAITAAPPRVRDIVAGQLCYIGLRTAVATVAFLVVMFPFGVVSQGWAVLAPPVALLMALAVAAPMMAFAATVEKDTSLALLFRFALLPMMLFSGVFFPLEQLPELLRPVAYLLPLWHGVELCRAAVVGLAPSWPVGLHLAYVVVWVLSGFLAAVARFQRRLVR